MKKKIIAILVTGILCVNLFAQEAESQYRVVDEKNNEVYIAAGLPSLIGLFSGVFIAIGEGIAESVNSDNQDNKSDAGQGAYTINFGYNHFFMDLIGVGLMCNYERFNNLELASLQAKASVQYGWDHFKFYHALSAGVLTVNAEAASFIFDLTWLGLKLDFDSFNIFLDASLPSTGIVKLGAAIKY